MERPAVTQRGTTQSTLPPAPPTTFVQADANSFRDVVQKLTGAAAGDSPDKLPVTTPSRPVVGPRRQAFKLHDRRPSVRKLEIKLGYTSLHSPRSPQLPPSPRLPISPSSPHLHNYQILMGNGGGNGSLAPLTPPFPSPVTPLLTDTLFSPDVSVEERAIAERRFYLHPSPRTTTPRGSNPPELLTLFPLTSPKQQPKSSGKEREMGFSKESKSPNFTCFQQEKRNGIQ